MSENKINKQSVLVTSYQPYTVNLIDKLNQEFNWQPVVWVTADENRHLVCDKYPEALQYDFHQMVKGISPSFLDTDDYVMPSPDELAELAQHEYNFLYMLERNDSNYSAFEYKERLAFYYRTIGLWTAVIRAL